MKKIKALLLLSFVLYLQFSLCYSQGKDGLVAAPYPGSIPEPPVELNSRTFYTKDPIEKVMAHYTKSLGAFEDRSQNSYFRQDQLQLFGNKSARQTQKCILDAIQ